MRGEQRPRARFSWLRTPSKAAPCYTANVRFRAIVAHAGLALFVTSGVYFFAIRAADEVKVVFTWAPRKVVPAKVVEQIAEIRSKIPCGAALAYVDPNQDHWHFGVWKRALHPGNILVPAGAEAELMAAREQLGVRYVLAVGDRPGWLRIQPLASLGGYPGGAPAVLGSLE
jgi:hypothetical protein